MRGYLSRTGMGLLAGVVVVAASLPLAWRVSAPQVSTDGRAQAMVGPFRARVERLVVEETPAAHRARAVAVVQLHLWRPGGPVPISRRVRVDGWGVLGHHWRAVSTRWLLKNEYVNLPPGNGLNHPALGWVPATRHAGEVRVLLTFEWADADRSPDSTTDFTFVLPDGRSVTLPGLKAEQHETDNVDLAGLAAGGYGLGVRVDHWPSAVRGVEGR